MSRCCRRIPLIVMPYRYLHGRQGEGRGLALDDGSHRCVVGAYLDGAQARFQVWRGTPTHDELSAEESRED
jgi:hypothetical protein